jgi:hypothetical protein
MGWFDNPISTMNPHKKEFLYDLANVGEPYRPVRLRRERADRKGRASSS